MKINSNEPILGIGIAAKKLGVSPELLRLYEREGLVKSHRARSGHRYYSEEDLLWVECLREQINQHKLNIAGIKVLLDLCHCWDFKNGCPNTTCDNCKNHEEFMIKAQEYVESKLS